MMCKCGGTLKHKKTIPATIIFFEEMVYECDRCKAIDKIRIMGGPDSYEKAITTVVIDLLERRTNGNQMD